MCYKPTLDKSLSGFYYIGLFVIKWHYAIIVIDKLNILNNLGGIFNGIN